MTTVFFPGKFQPPHIGHVMTITKIKKQFKKVIIGITEGQPRVISQEEVNTIFKTIFDDVEFILVKGTLTDYKNTNGLPDFDILLTGNDEVVIWAKSLNVDVLKIPRSKGILCSGTELREVIKECQR